MAHVGLVGCATLFFGSLVSWHFENDEGFIDAIRAAVNKLAGDDDGLRRRYVVDRQHCQRVLRGRVRTRRIYLRCGQRCQHSR